MSDDKFLLIKAWSYILWADIEHVLSHLLIAEITNRVPVVYWPTHCIYNGFIHTNGFELYFEPVSNYTIIDLVKPEYTYYPPVWDQDNLLMDDPDKETWVYRNIGEILSRKENVVIGDVYVDIYNLIPFIKKNHPAYGMTVNQVYSYLFKKYIRLKNDIEIEIQGFYNSWIRESKPVLAVHVCGAEKDKIYDTNNIKKQNYRYFSKSYKNAKHDIAKKKVKIPWSLWNRRVMKPNEPYQKEIKKYIDKYNVKKIFLITNSEEVLCEYKKKYGSMLVETQCKRESEEADNLYLENYIIKRRRGIEIIKDTYLASMCDFFIGNDFSSLSHTVTIMKDWPSENIKLLYWEFCKRKYPINGIVLTKREKKGLINFVTKILKSISKSLYNCMWR